MKDDPHNTNCLDGMQCPRCKSNGPFKIRATAFFTVTDDGTAEFDDLEYDDSNYCCCPECDEDGTVADFQARGQQ